MAIADDVVVGGEHGHCEISFSFLPCFLFGEEPHLSFSGMCDRSWMDLLYFKGLL